jgi:DNA-directed RNA polymerase subunit RPC12/RpoP
VLSSSNRKHLNLRETSLPSLEIYVMSEKPSRGLVYECVKCGAKVMTEELELRGGGVKCTFCGYRVLKKIRPPVVKRVSAE